MELSGLIELEVFDTLLDAVVVIDQDFNVHYANSAYAALCDSSVRRLLRKPKPISEALILEDDFFKATQVTYDESLSRMYREVDFRTPGEKSGTVQYCVQERKNSKSESYWVIFLRDVTLEKSLHDKYKLQLQEKEGVIEDLKLAQRKLKEYSEGLEAMVQERTLELRGALDFQRATLNCLGQGFFVFNSEGIVLPEYSRICPEMFGREPAGVHVMDLLGLQGKTRETFSSFLGTVFMDAIPFEDLLDLLAIEPVIIQGRTLKVDLYPMRDDSGLNGVVLVATDITKEMQYEQQLEQQKELADRITQVLRHPKQYLSFVKESDRLLNEMTERALEGALDAHKEETTRGLHTMKGGASSFYLGDYAQAVHSLEEKINSHFGNWGESAESWPLEFAKLKRAFKWSRKEVNDLLGIESRSEAGVVDVPVSVLNRWCQELESPNKSLNVSQEIFRDYLCESVEDLMGYLIEETQKLAALLGKKVFPLTISGHGIRLLPEFYQGVISNLVHCIRNSVDHGIEPEEERVELGKPPCGMVDIDVQVIKGARGKSEVQVIITDDGRGIDEKALRAKHPRGTTAERSEILLSIFDDGLSARDSVTTVSGMGVGMSALKAEILKIGGSVAVESSRHQGVKIILSMPKINSLSDYVGFLMYRPKAS